MATTQLADVIVPEAFCIHRGEPAEKSALVQSSVMARNQEVEAQLKAGADSFSVPYWKDLGDDEANITNDNPAQEATPPSSRQASRSFARAFCTSLGLQ